MIIKAHRFHGYGSLRGVYQRGQNVRGQHVSLKFGPRAGNKPYRVAVVVSRKVSKSAVIRNRIRRRIYEAVRRTESAIAPSTDLVFTVFDEKVANVEASKLEATIAELLQKTSQRASSLQTPVKHAIVKGKEK
jgi:ribonuclease P protein component